MMYGVRAPCSHSCLGATGSTHSAQVCCMLVSPPLLQVLVGGRIGPANPPVDAAANGDAHQQLAAAVNGSSNGAHMTPTRMTRRAAAAMAAASADGSSSSSSGGQFYPPTVIVGVTPDMDLYHEEVFGPVSCCSRLWVSCDLLIQHSRELHGVVVLPCRICRWQES